jgi:hypothetical protein
MLKSIIKSEALLLGLYKNAVTPDGNTVIDTLTPLTVVGGYAPIALANDVCLDALTANKWYISTDVNGRAVAQYHNEPIAWTFTADNVSLAETAYGIYGYTLILPFNTGTSEIKVGDTITGHTSSATAIVTGVFVTSGTWGAGTAAGWLCIKTQTGTFQNAEAIYVDGGSKAATNTGILGDSQKKLLFVEAFTSGYLIDTVGQKITYVPKITLSTT